MARTVLSAMVLVMFLVQPFFFAVADILGAVTACIAIADAGSVAMRIVGGLAHTVITAAHSHGAPIAVPHATGITVPFTLRAQHECAG